MEKTRVYFVGAGPGDPELLTLKGKALLEKADIVVYAGSLVNTEILRLCRSDAEIVDSAPLDLDAITKTMIRAVSDGKMVVRLHTGDPSLYGAIAEQIVELEKHEIACTIIPGVSSVFAAAASRNVEFTLPGLSQTLILTRRGGRTPVPPGESLALLAEHRASMAIFLSAAMIREAAAELIAGGYPEDTPACVVYRASWPDEQHVEGTLATLPDYVERRGISRQALILVGEAVGRGLTERSKLYAPDFAHGYRGGVRHSKALAVVAVSRRGMHTGMRVVGGLDDAVLYLPEKFREQAHNEGIAYYTDLQQQMRLVFHQHRSIVLIMATGIAVRMIAPLVRSKWEDPAVIAMDDGGRNVISLLSGHWGGANALAQKVARHIRGNPVVTTESDVMGFPSIDLMIRALTEGTVPKDAKRIKALQTAILEDEAVGFYPRALSRLPYMQGHPNLHFFDSPEEMLSSGCAACVLVSHHHLNIEHGGNRILVIHPRDLVVGIGCHRGITPEEIDRGIASVFSNLHLSEASIALLCSIDAKQNEGGLIAYARSRSIPLRFFSADDINEIQTVSADSPHAMKAVGAKGVAEPCAVLGAQGGGLLSHKLKLEHMTLAVAKVPLELIIERDSSQGIDENV